MKPDTYYKIMKLTTGETVVFSTDDPCRDIFSRKTISIIDPVMLQVMRMPKDNALFETYILIPWCSFAEDDVIEVSTSQIITIGNLKEGLRKNYLEYIIEKNKPKEQDEESSLTFEDFIDELEEEPLDEEERNTDTGIRGNTRILH